MEYFRQLIAEKHLHHTFWCYNANSGDTGGLVKDDFKTWDEEKYEFVKEVLWQTSDGKFIGLDHAVPLGKNGIALSEYSGVKVTPAPVTVTEETTETVAEDYEEEDYTYETPHGTWEEESSGFVPEMLRKAAKGLIIAAVIIVLLLIVFIALRVAAKNKAEKRKTEEVIKLGGYNKNTVDEKDTNEVNSVGGEEAIGELPEETREDN